jgi:hypothetical protein
VSTQAEPLLSGLRAPSAAAAEAFGCSLDHLLRVVGDPLAQIEPTLIEHPTFVMGHLLRAGVAVLAKDASASPRLEAALSAVARAGVQLTERERRHFAAATAWLAGEPLLAAERYAALLRQWPHDLLALRLAQSCYFFVGQTAALRDVTALVEPAWSRGMRGFECVLAMSAFGCAENGETGRAEALGRWAVEIEPAFPFAIHAVAHALSKRGDCAGGRLWMLEQQGQWLTDSRMVAHNAWHLAQFELASGRASRALAALDNWLMPSASGSVSVAADATALVWTLQLDGGDPGSRWSLLSDCWEAHHSPGFWPFLDLHAAIAFNAAGHLDRAQRLADAIAAYACADTQRARAARVVTLPGLRAIQAFAAGAYASACGALHALRPAIDQLGASHAQVALFERMLGVAEQRCRSSRPDRLSIQPRGVLTERYAALPFLRQVAGGTPNSRLKARLNAASES